MNRLLIYFIFQWFLCKCTSDKSISIEFFISEGAYNINLDLGQVKNNKDIVTKQYTDDGLNKKANADHGHDKANESMDGFMSAEDKKKLSTIEKGATKVIVDDDMAFRIKNGQVLRKFFDSDMAMILNKENNLLAIYKKKDELFVKPYKIGFLKTDQTMTERQIAGCILVFGAVILVQLPAKWFHLKKKETENT